MNKVRDYVNEGLSIRARAGIKVRQPLASVTVPNLTKAFDAKSILIEELNVKEVKIGGDEVSLDQEITPELKLEGIMREAVRFVQNARKKADLQVDDRIKLSILSDDKEITKAIEEHKDTVKAETLAVKLTDEEYEHTETVKINKIEAKISLEKAN